MAVPKFNKTGHHFQRAPHRPNEDDNTTDMIGAKKKGEETTSRRQFSSISMMFSERRHQPVHNNNSGVEQHHQQQGDDEDEDDTRRVIMEEKRDKLRLRAQRRIARNLDDDDDDDEKNKVPDVTVAQLDLGRVLGTGAFAAVRVVKNHSLFRQNEDDEEDGDNNHSIDTDPQPEEDASTTTSNNSSNSNSTSNTGNKYVVKMMRADLFHTKTSNMLASIAADLVKEGQILAGLTQHRNILKLVGCTQTGVEGFFSGDDDNDTDNKDSSSLLNPAGYVLVLERLAGDLTEKCVAWKHRMKQIHFDHVADLVVPHIHPYIHPDHYQPGARGADTFWLERLDMLYQLADGLAYLHAQRILHRDLKPDNIGFDYTDPTTVKIFDFNVARTVPSPPSIKNKKKNEHELFRMTQNVGSRRYMAPEVGQPHKLYNQKVDIYAFGLIAYQVLVLPASEKVFPDIMTVEQHERRVIQKGERPSLPSSKSKHNKHGYWSKPLRTLIERSWSKRIRDRPSAHELKLFLQQEIQYQQDRVDHKLRLSQKAAGPPSKVSPVSGYTSSVAFTTMTQSQATTTTINDNTKDGNQHHRHYGPRTRFGRLLSRTFSRRRRRRDRNSSPAQPLRVPLQRHDSSSVAASSMLRSSCSSSSSCWSVASSKNNTPIEDPTACLYRHETEHEASSYEKQ